MLILLPVTIIPFLDFQKRVVKYLSKFFSYSLKRLVGIDYMVSGYENIPESPCIFACKHQSTWETMASYAFIPPYVVVLKKELVKAPLFGWYLHKIGTIAVDREKGVRAIQDMVDQAKKAMERGRYIFIFPEGTRTEPGQSGKYHPGVYALYKELNVPIVPIALNSGVYWGRRKAVKKRGTIEVHILPPIQPGIERKELMQTLQDSIEVASLKLVPNKQPVPQEVDNQVLD